MLYKDLKEQISGQKIVPLYYHDDKNISIEILRSLYHAGSRVVEYTHRGIHALHNFLALQKTMKNEMPGLLLGIGTVFTVTAAQEYIDAGASFIVSPVVDPAIGKLSLNNNIPWIPGCITPTEIFTAKNTGAEIIKLFPANLLEPSYLKSISEVFPGTDFMPTGGISMEIKKIIPWFDAGAIAVGLGSKLINREYIESGNYHQLFLDTKKLFNDIRVPG